MKLIRVLFMLTLLSLIMFSCDEDDVEINPLVGSWSLEMLDTYGSGTLMTSTINFTFEQSNVSVSGTDICQEGDEAPECVKDCDGWNDDFENGDDMTAACNWVNGLDVNDDCFSDCNDTEMDSVELQGLICETCIANESCDDNFEFDNCQEWGCNTVGTWSVDGNQLSLIFSEESSSNVDECLYGEILATYNLNGDSLSITIVDEYYGYDITWVFTRD